MTTLSSFQINQPPGTPYGTWDRSRRDIDLYSVASEAVECEAQNKSETSYLWEMISEPDGVTVTVNNSTTHTCNFQLDTRGSYLIRLTVNDGLPNKSITTLFIGVALEGSGLWLSAMSETNHDNSQSPYTGERGYEEKLNALLNWLNIHMSVPKEYVGTSKTLVASESGRWFEASAGSVVFTLPTAAEGLSYHIGAGSGQTTQIDRAGADVINGSFVPDFGSVTSLTIADGGHVHLVTSPDGVGGWDWYVEDGSGTMYETGAPANKWVHSFRKVETLGTDGASGTVPVSNGSGGFSMQPIDVWNSDAVVVVSSGGTPVNNGTNLKNAYTAAKALTPGGNALAEDNRAIVLIPPGQYDLGASTWAIDGNYVDLIGMGGGTHRQDDGTILCADVLIWGGGDPAVNQTVNDVRMANITIGQDTNDQDCMEIDVATTYADKSMYKGVGFRAVASATGVNAIVQGTAGQIHSLFEDCHTTLVGFIRGGTFAGTLKRCSGGDGSFAGWEDSGSTENVTFSGYAEDCIGDQYCFAANAGGGDATFSGEAIRCKVTSEGFASAAGTAGDVTCSGSFTDCDSGTGSGANSFGYSAAGAMVCSGNFRRCRSGNKSFGCVDGAAMTSDFSGDAIDCDGGQYCFGSNSTTVANGSCTGDLTRCEASRYSFGARGEVLANFTECTSTEYGSFGDRTTSGASKFLRCYISGIATASGGPVGLFGALVIDTTFVATTGSPVLLNGDGTKFYGCSFHSVDDASSSVDASAARSASLAHCRMNIDIDSNVTNNLGAGNNVVDADFDV